MEDALRLMIPILALSIPVIALIGGVIVKPLAEALRRPEPDELGAAERAALQRRVEGLEDRLAGMEHTLLQVRDAQHFDAQIGAGGMMPPASPENPSSSADR